MSLIRCKHCGGEAAMERSIGRAMWAIECRNCGAVTNSIYLKQDAVRRWNDGEQIVALSPTNSNPTGNIEGGA